MRNLKGTDDNTIDEGWMSVKHTSIGQVLWENGGKEKESDSTLGWVVQWLVYFNPGLRNNSISKSLSKKRITALIFWGKKLLLPELELKPVSVRLFKGWLTLTLVKLKLKKQFLLQEVVYGFYKIRIRFSMEKTCWYQTYSSNLSL